jgi:hypothetical protein
MPIAQIGPLTGLLEGAAATIAAGMLLGGFLTGLVGLVKGWPRRQFDWLVVQFGYGGGALSVAVMIADITFHHAL